MLAKSQHCIKVHETNFIRIPNRNIKLLEKYFLYMRMIALCIKLISYNISSLSSAPSMSLIY